MLPTVLTQALAVSLTLMALAGCSSTLMTGASATGSSTEEQNLMFGPGGFGQGGPGGPGGMMGLDRYLSSLELTADQQTKLQAIATQPPTMPSAPPSSANLQALLTAETLDQAAIRTAVAQPPQGGQDTTRIAQIQAVYDLLTDSQRTALAAALEADAGGMAPPPGGPMDASADLALTAEQQAAYDAYLAKLPAQHGPVDNTALAAYFTTGDASGLTSSASTFPVDELIALATSLSVEQRQTLFSRGIPGMGGQPMGAPPA